MDAHFKLAVCGGGCGGGVLVCVYIRTCAWCVCVCVMAL